MSNPNKPLRPPRLADALLRLLCRPHAHSTLADDMEEEFLADRLVNGSRRARRTYRKLLLISLPSIMKNSFQWSLAMIRNYFRISLRNILRNRMFAIINIFGLAVGMACFILISLWIRDELAFDKFHLHKDRIYHMTIRHGSGVLDPNVPYALAARLSGEYPEIEAYTRILEYSEQTTCSLRSQVRSGEDRQFYEDGVIRVDPEFFDIFSFPFVHGRPETALRSPDSVVLSEETAEKYFGDLDPVGAKLTMNNHTDLEVTGVVRVPARSSLRFDVLFPLRNRMTDNWNWSDRSYLLLNSEADPGLFEEKIASTLERLSPYPDPSAFRVEILPLEKSYLEFGRRTYVYLFSVIAAFILFIACVNYMNLATAASANRVREVGLRKVVGASRPQVILQFLSESILTAAAALPPAVLLVYLLLPWLNRQTGKYLSLSSAADSTHFLLLGFLVLVVGAVSGCYPALFLSSKRPAEIFSSSSRAASARSLFRVVTVVGQFTLSVILIAITLTASRQIRFFRNRPMGLSTDSVVQFKINPTLRRRFQSFKRELTTNPNVLNVTAGQSAPYAEDYKTSGVEWDGKSADFNPTVRYSIAQFGYLSTFDIRIARGRDFSEDNPADRDHYLINQTAARYMGMDEPVGKRLALWGREGRIIGVVSDYHHVSLHREIMPQIFTVNPAFHNALRRVFIKISPAGVPDTIRHIQDVCRRMAPEYPFSFTFMDEDKAEMYRSEQQVGRIFSGFALLAVVISCLGIFGLSAFTAEQRTKEIGIRKALGASSPGIVALLSRNFSRWVLTANLIALPFAYFGINRLLRNYAYRIEITPDLFLISAVISIAAAALPSVYHAVRAAQIDPVKSLRYE